MNKSKIKKLMWASLIVVASLIIIFVSSANGIIFGFLTALIYCSIPAVLTTLAHLELNKGDVKTIEEFDVQEELNQHIKEVNKQKRQNWWKANKKWCLPVIIGISVIILILIAYWLWEIEVF
jgi:purine-cytosine permease-like protein